MRNFIRVYSGYCLGFASYRILLYVLSTICEQVDGIIYADMLKNKNVLPDGTEQIGPSYDYKVGKEIVEVIKTRVGELIIYIYDKDVIYVAKKAISLTGKVVYIGVKPISKAIGFVVMKYPPIKKVHKMIKVSKKVIVATGGLISLGIMARSDYWAIVFSNALPQLPVDTKAKLSGIRRMRRA